MFKNKPKNGFSLIELLVVILIISILATLSFFAFNLAQEKTRDVKRKSDLDSLKKALFLFKADTKSSAYFPKDASLTDCSEPTSSICIPKTALIYTGTPAYTYMKKIPREPKTKQDYYYKAYLQDGTTACTTPLTAPFTPSVSTDCTTFTLIACLENASDPKADRNPATGKVEKNTTACPQTGGASYTVRN